MSLSVSSITLLTTSVQAFKADDESASFENVRGTMQKINAIFAQEQGMVREPPSDDVANDLGLAYELLSTGDYDVAYRVLDQVIAEQQGSEPMLEPL